MWVLQRPEEGVRFPADGGMDVCESSGNQTLPSARAASTPKHGAPSRPCIGLLNTMRGRKNVTNFEVLEK